MAKREVITLPSAQVEVEERSGYLFIVESGQLRSLAEVEHYHRAIGGVIQRTGIKSAIIDARGEVGDPPAEVRDEMWRWLLDPARGFETVAFVLPTEMAVARVNMTSLSKRARVRAFDSVFAAQRWLGRGPRFSAADTRAPSSSPSARRTSDVAHAPTEQAFAPPSASPPSPPKAASPKAPAKSPSSPGAYYTTRTKTERPGAFVSRDAVRRDPPQPSDRASRTSDFRTKGKPGGSRAKKGSTGDEGGGGSQVA